MLCFCNIILNPITIIGIHNNLTNLFNESSNWCDSDVQNNNNNNKTNTFGQR